MITLLGAAPVDVVCESIAFDDACGRFNSVHGAICEPTVIGMARLLARIE